LLVGLEIAREALDGVGVDAVPVVGGLAPRDQWHLYSHSVNYLRDTNEIGPREEELLLGETIRRC
jgi:hypothetical protein